MALQAQKRKAPDDQDRLRSDHSIASTLVKDPQKRARVKSLAAKQTKVRRAPGKKKNARERDVHSNLLQQAFHEAQKDVTGIWLLTSEPGEADTHGAMCSADINQFEREGEMWWEGGRLMCNLGAIAAMYLGDIVFWYDRALGGITGLLIVTELPSPDPTITYELPSSSIGFRKARTKKRKTFAEKVAKIKPGILRVKLSWAATFMEPVTATIMTDPRLINQTTLNLTVTQTITRDEYVPLFQKKYYNIEDRTVQAENRGINAKLEDSIIGTVCWDIKQRIISATQDPTGLYTITETMVSRPISSFTWWWQTGQRAAVTPLRSPETQALLDLCEIRRAGGILTERMNGKMKQELQNIQRHMQERWRETDEGMELIGKDEVIEAEEWERRMNRKGVDRETRRWLRREWWEERCRSKPGIREVPVEVSRVVGRAVKVVAGLLVQEVEERRGLVDTNQDTKNVKTTGKDADGDIEMTSDWMRDCTLGINFS